MYNKRLNSLMSLATKPTVSVEDAEPEVVTQPAEGNPQTETQQAVLTDQAQAEAARAVEENQVPADGNIPASDTNAAATQAVSQEQQSTVEQAPVATETDPGNPNARDGDGSGTEPATPADAAVSDPVPTNDGTNTTPASPAAVADVQDPAKAQPTFEAPPAAVAAANQAPPADGDANNPSEMPDSLPKDDKTDLSELKPNTVNAVGNEELTPEDLAAVKDVVQEVVAAEPAATDVPPPAAGDTPVSEPAVAEATTDAPPTEGAVDAPAVTEGEPAVAPAEAVQEAAQAAADIIANAGENAPEAAQAVDAVADAAVAAANGDDVTPAGAVAAQDALDNSEAGTSAVEAGESGQGEVEDTLDEDLDNLGEATDELSASAESLMYIGMALEDLADQVETTLGNGGLSDDAAGILNTSVGALADQADVEMPTTGLESIAYADREITTAYGLEALDGTAKEVNGKFVGTMTRLADAMSVYTRKVSDWSLRSEKDLKALRAKVAALPEAASRDTVKSKSASNRLSIDGKFPANVAQASKITVGIAKDVLNDFMTAVISKTDESARLVTRTVSGATELKDELDKLDAIDFSVPKSVKNDVTSSNAYSKMAPKNTVKGSDLMPGNQRLIAITNRKDNMTTYSLFEEKQQTNDEFPTPSKADMIAAIQAAEEAVAILDSYVGRRDRLLGQLKELYNTVLNRSANPLTSNGRRGWKLMFNFAPINRKLYEINNSNDATVFAFRAVRNTVEGIQAYVEAGISGHKAK